MGALDTAIDPESAPYAENRAVMLERLAEWESALDEARSGGGERQVTRHHARGKLLPRERVELLVDQDSPFLELSPAAGWGTGFPVGGGIVTGIGVVEGVECVIIANDPTVHGGAVNPYSLRKARRAGEIAATNRLPVINLVESSGVDLNSQAEIFIPGGEVLRDLARLSASRVPTLSVVFGMATAGAAYLPGMSDYTIMVRNQARVFLAGPALVRAVTGEVTDDESLGGAAMHAGRSGLADFLAEDERDGIRLVRRCVRRLNWRKQGPPPRSATPAPPRHDPQDLLALPAADPRVPFDPREVLARVLDGSEFDEFKPGYGGGLVTGWGELHGYPIGVLANARGVLCSAEARKAAHFIQLANATDTPLLFLQNTTGYVIGAEHEQRGIIKHGAHMINAVANSAVPHLTVNIGASYGAGNYGMCGRSCAPRFLFAWPNSRSAMVGPAQLAGVLAAPPGPDERQRDSRQASGCGPAPSPGTAVGPRDAPAPSPGTAPGLRAGPAPSPRPATPGPDGADPRRVWPDGDPDRAVPPLLKQQIESESAALFLSGRLSDDGLIDPRDTRTVLGLCLSAVHSGPVCGARGFGIFRM